MTQQRSDELLAGAAGYVLAHGFAGLSLRPMAKDLGTSDRMLLYHFGSKAALVRRLMEHVSDELGTALDGAIGNPGHPSSVVRGLWRVMVRPEVVPLVRAYIELITLSFHEADLYGGSVRDLTASFTGFVAALLQGAGVDSTRAKAEAVSVLGTLEGAFLYWHATGDREGADAAVEALANA